MCQSNWPSMENFRALGYFRNLGRNITVGEDSLFSAQRFLPHLKFCRLTMKEEAEGAMSLNGLEFMSRVLIVQRSDPRRATHSSQSFYHFGALLILCSPKEIRRTTDNHSTLAD